MGYKETQKADLILLSNALFTGRQERPIVGSVLIKGNRIFLIRKDHEVKQYIGPETQVFRFENELIMPGFHDSHVHLIMGGLSQECVNLHDASSEEEAAQMVYDYSKTIPEDPWILGFSWYHVFWEKKTLPNRSTLDKLIPSRPVFLLNADGHGAWVNSKAMEICKINSKTPDPPFGEIARDENGYPTGYLYETAMNLVTSYAYEIPPEKEKTIIKNILSKAVKNGITSLCDLQPVWGRDMGNLNIYKEFEANNNLTVRIHFNTSLNEDLEKARFLEENYCSEKLVFSGFKEFLDGVATTYTAYMLEPYSDKPGSSGGPLINPDDVKKLVIMADKEGFRVRLHACGDGAVRLGLDCIEAARNVNGARDARHTIEHIENIHPDDVGRFNELGVIASMQPEHMTITENFIENPYRSRLGPEREQLIWPLKSLLRNGAIISLGSDYPVVDLNPFPSIYRAVTRLHNDGEPKGGWIPQERLTISETLMAYTYGSAYAAFRENEIGILDKGWLADLIVLDRNLFEIKEEEIMKTKVILTIMDGKVVYKTSDIN